MNRNCPVCGGEFWDVGTSCTCYEDDEKKAEEEIVEDIVKEQEKESLK